jgi:polyhydroxybutyrate depolymerase
MIKRFLIAALILLHSVAGIAGFINGTMVYQNKTRKYVLYVPDIYTTQHKKVPLLVGLHGFGDDAANFSGICISAIADTANYIALYPEATPDPVLSATAWNSGASAGLVVVNPDVDDKGFINKLMDSIIATYMIDTTRMYVFGFSFGGFMTNRMAAECSKRFAAAASVSGLRGNSITALPQNSMPYLHFHGTSDQTIGYYGTSTLGFLPGLGMSAENTVKFWAKQDHCDSLPVIDSMPNIANDGLRFVRFTYNNGIGNSKVIFYKVINGQHSWYGLPANDISYCQTIWAFFRQYSRNATLTSVQNRGEKGQIKVYPNPSGGMTTVDISGLSERPVSLQLYDAAGHLAYSVQVKGQDQITLDPGIPAGMYIIQLSGVQGTIATEKVVIR